jgi:acyl carrier protein
VAQVPEMSVLFGKLEQLAQAKIDPDTPISQINVSSLDLVEWTVLLEDEYHINLEDIQIEEFRNLTPRLLYESVFAQRWTEPLS